MLKWMKNYYIGNDVKNPTRIRARITAGKFVPDIYVVTLSDNPGNILEILPAGMLVQRSARATCPLIVGMARGKSGAIQMVQDLSLIHIWDRLLEQEIMRRTSPRKS